MDAASLALPSDPSTPAAKSSDVLRFALKTVNEQLDFLKSQWEGDKHRLLGERDVLREAAKRTEEDKARRARDEKKRGGVEAVGRLLPLVISSGTDAEVAGAGQGEGNGR